MTLKICIAENRRSCEPALRILVASLKHHCPDLPVELYAPAASTEFIEWLAQWDEVFLNPRPLQGEWAKYDIKPIALLTVLESGASEALWIDSDILVTRDFRPLLRSLAYDALAVAEEALCSSHADPEALRAKLWGFPVGRTFPFAANTGIIRVTPAHLSLLHRWNTLLQSETYRNAQAQPWYSRGLHMLGDQEVLTALLTSKEFAHLPVRFIRRGPDIIQFFGSSGYTFAERITHISRGSPYFVHSQNYRPWWPPAADQHDIKSAFGVLYNELSPYIVHARRYAEVLEDRSWLEPRSTAAKVATVLGAGFAPTTGLPLALAADIVRASKSVLRLLR